MSDERKLSNPENGFWVDFSLPGSGALHQFCGPHEIHGATCPNCAKPLLRILSLSAADLRLNVNPEKTTTVHLLYCWTCSIPFGAFSYRLLRDGSVELLQVPPPYEWAFGAEGPYDGYTGQFPLQQVHLISLSEEERREQRTAQSDVDLALDLPRKHQIGGLPVINNPIEIVCPVCSKEPPLLAVICDNATGSQVSVELPSQDSFTDNSGTQMVFHFCRDCSAVTAYHSND